MIRKIKALHDQGRGLSVRAISRENGLEPIRRRGLLSPRGTPPVRLVSEEAARDDIPMG